MKSNWEHFATYLGFIFNNIPHQHFHQNLIWNSQQRQIIVKLVAIFGDFYKCIPTSLRLKKEKISFTKIN